MNHGIMPYGLCLSESTLGKYCMGSISVQACISNRLSSSNHACRQEAVYVTYTHITVVLCCQKSLQRDSAIVVFDPVP